MANITSYASFGQMMEADLRARGMTDARARPAQDKGGPVLHEFARTRVRDSTTTEAFRKKALELMDEGKTVVIGYERLAYGGGEGYVTLMVKDGDA